MVTTATPEVGASLTTEEVAALLRIKIETVRRKLRNGEIKGYQVPSASNIRGRWRITAEELQRLQAGP